MRLGFIGTGTIAAAVVRGIAHDGHAITVSERGAAQSAALARAFDSVAVSANQGVIDASDVLFLGLLPQVAPEILASLRFRADQRVISFMAGVALDRLAALVAPARAEAIMLPFPGIAKGGSPILALGDTELVSAIFGAANTVFEMKDAAALDAYLCAQAVLSPAVLMVARAADWLAGQGVERAEGEAFLRVLVGSSLIAGDCRTTLAALDTPGGYNQRLRLTVERAGLDSALADGLDVLKG